MNSIINSLEFSQYLQQYQTKLNVFALSLTNNRVDAQDLYQETVLLAYKNKNKFTQGTNFLSWLKTIMKNTFINQYRRKRRYNKIIKGGAKAFFNRKETGANQTENELNVKELYSLIEGISERFKVPFLMYHQGYTYEEISTELQLPLGTTKSRIFHARKYLKQDYQQLFNI